MKTPLDEVLFRLMDEHPGWAACLAPEDACLLRRRRQGASLKELGAGLGMTVPGVRRRLYGDGCGQRRSGGVLGKLRGLAMRERRAALAEAQAGHAIGAD